MIGNAPDFKQPKPNFTAFHNHYGKEFKSEVLSLPIDLWQEPQRERQGYQAE